MSNIVCVLLGILLVAIASFIEFRRYCLRQQFKNIKSGTQYPIIGSKIVLKPNSVEDYVEFFKTIHFDKITILYVFHKHIFFVSDPVVCQKMFTGSNWSDRPFIFSFSRLKYGIITSTHEHWKPVRKAINPAFSQRMALSFISTFAKHFEYFSTELEKQIVSENAFDINEISMVVGIKVIFETNFGIVNDDALLVLKPYFEKFLVNIARRVVNPYTWPDVFYQYTSLGKEDQEIDSKLYEGFMNLIANREKYWANRSKDPNVVNVGRLFIDEMIEHARSDQYDGETGIKVLIENMITIVLAGFETSAVTVSYVLLMIAMHPEIDAKLEKEIFENYSPGEVITQETLKKMVYLEMVIKETLRLFPPVPVTARSNLEDTHIDEIGTLEKGTIIAISYYNLHRWKDVWGADADEFNPEHFTEENCSKRNPFAFLPFGGGARACVGNQYAMLNMKVGLLILLSRFKFSTDLKMHDLVLRYDVSLKLVNKHMVKVHRRDRRV